jgi:hypothetical protein
MRYYGAIATGDPTVFAPFVLSCLAALEGCVGEQIGGRSCGVGKSYPGSALALPLSFGFSLVRGHYEICEVVEKAKEEHCTPYQVGPFVGIKVAQVLDKAAGIISALATIAIAIVTFTLKRATDKLSDAGERQIGIAARTAELTRQQVQSLDRKLTFK